jgi:hypothetical protein
LRYLYLATTPKLHSLLIINLLAESIGLSSFYKQVGELRISTPAYSDHSSSYEEGMLSNLSAAGDIKPCASEF